MQTSRYKFKIDPQFVDFQKEIKLSSLVELTLMVSGYNADSNKFGIRDLNKIGATWVISRFALEVKKYPKQHEEIEIETWVSEINTYNTIRNYRITDIDGKIVAEGTSVWVMIGIKSRRPMELELLKSIKKFVIEEEVEIERTQKLDGVECEPIFDYHTKYGDIDINRHVNSIRYIDWMLNTFTLDEHKSQIIKRLDLNFMHEILFNEHILMYKKETSHNIYSFEIKTEGQTACRGRMRIEQYTD